MAIGQKIFNKLQNVPKGTTLKIIYDGGSRGRTRYAKYDSMVFICITIDPLKDMSILLRMLNKTLFVKNFHLDVNDNNDLKLSHLLRNIS